MYNEARKKAHALYNNCKRRGMNGSTSYYPRLLNGGLTQPSDLEHALHSNPKRQRTVNLEKEGTTLSFKV
ncbi:hypothetical protein M405DRAFT_861431 [Rhizopogon salebrosus TDB-379]|nr:hypothetical protein M405DRAFT_861431 [Rhizopogon salebrosus TDB-379]